MNVLYQIPVQCCAGHAIEIMCGLVWIDLLFTLDLVQSLDFENHSFEKCDPNHLQDYV